MKKTVALGLCLLLLLTGCQRTEKKTYQAHFLSLFDTVTTIVGFADSKEEFSELAGQIQQKLEEYHQLYDIYNDYEGVNNLKTVNDNAGIAPVAVDGRIIDLLRFSMEQYEATGGAVNVAFGPVLALWHDYREAGLEDPGAAALPPMELLTQALAHTDIEDVIVDEEASTVYLSDPSMRLDVGAVAKGYAVEQVARYFEDEGVQHLLLSVGGNVRAIGGKLEDKTEKEIPWEIGIQNPDKSSSESELLSLLITGRSVVSSGIYGRYYTVDGVQYHHIIDPATLMPSAYFAQVTIVCPDSGLADALSTAVFNMPLDEGLAYIESLPDVEALWVMKDGTLAHSSGFESLIK
ncbi:MAG TPA: FAD:protein FMN transferase [Candidatus Acidoferrum sp.]|nr:FAD:protein FMN transferase [Candidatus Acidoferrum sp.]